MKIVQTLHEAIMLEQAVTTSLHLSLSEADFQATTAIRGKLMEMIERVPECFRDQQVRWGQIHYVYSAEEMKDLLNKAVYGNAPSTYVIALNWQRMEGWFQEMTTASREIINRGSKSIEYQGGIVFHFSSQGLNDLLQGTILGVKDIVLVEAY